MNRDFIDCVYNYFHLQYSPELSWPWWFNKRDKNSIIEAFAHHLCQQGKKISILVQWFWAVWKNTKNSIILLSIIHYKKSYFPYVVIYTSKSHKLSKLITKISTVHVYILISFEKFKNILRSFLIYRKWLKNTSINYPHST